MLVEQAVVASKFGITEVVSGCAVGVDTSGEVWARKNNRAIVRFPANWKGDGDNAGPIRNQKMVNYADALIAVWDGQSNGTRDVIDRAERKGIKIYVHLVKQ